MKLQADAFAEHLLQGLPKRGFPADLACEPKSAKNRLFGSPKRGFSADLACEPKSAENRLFGSPKRGFSADLACEPKSVKLEKPAPLHRSMLNLHLQR